MPPISLTAAAAETAATCEDARAVVAGAAVEVGIVAITTVVHRRSPLGFGAPFEGFALVLRLANRLEGVRGAFGGDRDGSEGAECHDGFGVDFSGATAGGEDANGGGSSPGESADAGSGTASGCRADGCAGGGGGSGGGGVTAARSTAIVFHDLGANRQLLPVGEADFGEFNAETGSAFGAAGFDGFGDTAFDGLAAVGDGQAVGDDGLSEGAAEAVSGVAAVTG